MDSQRFKRTSLRWWVALAGLLIVAATCSGEDSTANAPSTDGTPPSTGAPYDLRPFQRDFTSTWPLDLADLTPNDGVTYVESRRGFVEEPIGSWRVGAHWGDRCAGLRDCAATWDETLAATWDGNHGEYNDVYAIVVDGEVRVLAPKELGPFLGSITSMTEAGLRVGGFEVGVTDEGFEVVVSTLTNQCPVEYLYRLFLVRLDGTTEVLDRITSQEVRERENAVGKVSQGCV